MESKEFLWGLKAFIKMRYLKKSQLWNEDVLLQKRVCIIQDMNKIDASIISSYTVIFHLRNLHLMRLVFEDWRSIMNKIVVWNMQKTLVFGLVKHEGYVQYELHWN